MADQGFNTNRFGSLSDAPNANAHRQQQQQQQPPAKDHRCVFLVEFLDLMSDRLYALLLAAQVIITFGLLLNIEE